MDPEQNERKGDYQTQQRDKDQVSGHYTSLNVGSTKNPPIYQVGTFSSHGPNRAPLTHSASLPFFLPALSLLQPQLSLCYDYWGEKHLPRPFLFIGHPLFFALLFWVLSFWNGPSCTPRGKVQPWRNANFFHLLDAVLPHPSVPCFVRTQ